MSPTPLDVLRTRFGFQGFRGPQAGVIDRVMAGEDLALIMPTGAGKSLCYQIPAICRPGCGIVISPLIALMADQVRALALAGVRAAALNSQTADPAGVARAFRAGQLDLVYVAPERAATDGFIALARSAPVSLLAIDEAHCVSQWGHDFRPDYRRLRRLADSLPGVPRLALTATADAATRADICAELGIAPAGLVVAGFDRPNIRYSASLRTRATDQLTAFVRAQGSVPGIVYAPTRTGAERAASALQSAGIRSFVYHAGLDAAARAAAQKGFDRADHGVMCATLAFGMGIDKPDIRFVVHMGLPKSIEAYYQETGRAGRDGAAAVAQLFWGPADVVLARQRILEGNADEPRKQHELQQLARLADWAAATACRRIPLLTHFGEPAPPPCGNCDNCLMPPAIVDLTESARKLLSAVWRTGQMFGLAHVARVLRGDTGDKRIASFGHDRLSVFGIGKDIAESQWLRLGRLLEARQALVRDPDHGGLRLGPRARSILKAEERVETRAEGWAPAPRRARRTGSPGAGLPPADGALFELLRAWRRQAAQDADVAAYVILHDSTLAAIAAARPTTLEALGQLPGIGAAKLDRYGPAIVATVSNATGGAARLA